MLLLGDTAAQRGFDPTLIVCTTDGLAPTEITETLFDPEFVTYAKVPPDVTAMPTPIGLLCTGTVAATVCDEVLMTETLLESPFTTETAVPSGVNAKSSGPDGT